jgi:hypothetical protein
MVAAVNRLAKQLDRLLVLAHADCCIPHASEDFPRHHDASVTVTVRATFEMCFLNILEC